MANRFAFDDSEDEELWEEQEKKRDGKNMRTRKEFKKDQKRDATWAHERATREKNH